MGEHTGANMSKYVIKVLKEYSITHNLGYFVMDNAPDNNTMMTVLSLALQRDFNLKYDPIHHWVCCQGHIINLTVKPFLFVTNKETLDKDKEQSIYNITVKEIE